MFTRQDFKATAALVRALPKAKKQEFFDQWCQKFIASNIRFSEEKFAESCGIKLTPKYEYTPPAPEVLAEVPKTLTQLRLVCINKPTRKEHWDVYFGKVKIGYTYKCSFTYESASFFVERENNPYYTLLRHVHDGSYTGLYRLCLILNAYWLNSDRTFSVDCTGRHLGWIVVRPDGLNCSDTKNTVCPHEGSYDVYKRYKKVGVKMPKFGDYTPTDDGIFIKEQMGRFYNQIAITHATVWRHKKDAERIARKVKGRVRPLADWRKTRWETTWQKQHAEARQKEIDIATKNLNTGFV